MLNIKPFVVNPFGENTYLVYDNDGNCLVIDPGCFTERESKNLLDYMSENNLTPSMVLYTHCHVDHIVGAPALVEKFKNLKIYAHRDEEVTDEEVTRFAAYYGFDVKVTLPRITNYLEDGDTIQFGSQQIKVLCVPGHSPAGLCYYFESENIVFCGDVLFKGSIGRADLKGGDFGVLIPAIKNKLLKLPDDCECLCGHGPYTTIGYEKERNPFLI